MLSNNQALTRQSATPSMSQISLVSLSSQIDVFSLSQKAEHPTASNATPMAMFIPDAWTGSVSGLQAVSSWAGLRSLAVWPISASRDPER